MAAQPDVLLQCFQDASSAARPALERCMEQAIAALQLLETQSLKIVERDAIAASYRYLLTHKKLWSERYAADLLAEFVKSAEPKQPAVAASVTSIAQPFTRSGPLAFNLVDDADVSQAIDGQRLLQNLLPAVEQSLTELNALMSSALGLDHVMPERNPLRPEVYTQVLQQLATSTLESSTEAAMAFKHLARPLGHELVQIYASTIKTLKLARVTAASYQYRLQPSAPSAASGHSTPSASTLQNQAFSQNQAYPAQSGEQGNGFDGNELLAPADLSDVHVKTRLLNDFLAGHGQAGEQALAAPYYDDIEQELTAIKAARDSTPAALAPSMQAQLANMPAVDRPQRAINGLSSLSEQVWGPYGTSRARAMVRSQLKKEATKVSQALGMEVVRELVNQVAQDPRLLGPVREAIVALEPSLLRLALVDPRFFSDERHPGRKMMERVAQRSFKYNDEFSDEFAVFFQGISESFNQLNAAPVDSAKPFAAALVQLENKWNDHDQQDFDKRQQVLKALRFAEERQSRADQIAFDLSARSDLQQVPGKVLDFLFGRWALVMAHAQLLDTRNQIDPGGYGSIVSDLVWSVKSDVTLKQPAKLIDMIPGLLDKLHSGLALLGQEPKENEEFFEHLMKLHRPVLRLRRLKSQRDAQESSAALLEPEEPLVSPAERLESLRANADAPLWMGREELDAAGFEDTLPTMPAELNAFEPHADQDLPVLRQEQSKVGASAAEHVQSMEAGSEAGLAPESTDGLPNERLAGKSIGNAQDWTKASAPAATQAGLDKVQASAMLRSLTTGSWVDLYSKNQWLRAQLVWASSKATLFMFISHGGRPHSMTQRSCEKLLAQRLLRPVHTHGVIAQALDGVAELAAAQSLSVNARPVTAPSDNAIA